MKRIFQREGYHLPTILSNVGFDIDNRHNYSILTHRLPVLAPIAVSALVLIVSLVTGIAATTVSAANTTIPTMLGKSEKRQVCEYVAELAQLKNFRRDWLVSFGEFDANNDGQIERVGPGLTGTMRGDAYELVTHDQQKHRIMYDRTGIPDEEWNKKLRVSFGAAWLRFRGRYYLVHSREKSARLVVGVGWIAPDNIHRYICSFDHIITKSIGPTNNNLENVALCEKLDSVADDNFAEFSNRPRMTWQELKRRSPGGQHMPAGRAELDFDNDGKTETLLEINIASSAGRGCILNYFDLLDERGSVLQDGKKQKLLMALQNVNTDDAYPHRHCYNDLRWIRFLGKTYLRNKHRDDKPRNARGLHYTFSTIRHGIAAEICRGYFHIKHRISKIF